MRVEKPARRKTQGFLSYVNQLRVSRILRRDRKVVVDGKQVNIPARLLLRWGDGEG